MSIKTLRIKKAVSAAFVVLLLLVAGLSQAKAQDITVGNLNYTINEDGTTVTLTGHVDGTNATGELVIPASVEYYGNSYAVTSIANSAFYNCTGFTGNLVIPNSVITIGVSAFYSCTGFTGSLTIPNSVTQINARAFQYCSGLSGTLTIPESVTWIGLIAFYGAEFSVLNFNAINCNLTWDDVCVDPDCWTWGYFNSFGGLTAVSTLNIGENVQVITYCAFRNFSNLTGNLVIPNSVTSIGNYAFEYCSGLSGTLTIPDGLTAIGNSAFHECTGFTGSLDIPNSVAQVGSNAFNGCSGLTGALTIGNGVTQIYENAFANTGFTALNFNAVNCATFNSSWLTGVTTLTSLSIGDQVRRIPDGFLTDFSGITGELTIPNAVTYIGSSAFANCTGLSGTLTLGMSLTEIGNSAFFGSCANLTSVVVRTQVPPTLGSNVFTSAPADIPVEVPCGTLTAYQEASVWGNFVNLQETDPCEWVISTAVNPAEGGTVAGAGIYIQGQTCTLTATSNADYAFVNWTEDGEEVCTDAVYAFTVSSSRNLVANFRYIRYDITASVYAGLGGSVSGGGSFLEGETCTLVATPDEDYVFVNWTLNGEEVSTEAEFVFTVTSDGHYVANFRYNIFTVSYSAIPPTGGSVTINQVAHSMDYYFDFESGFQGWTTIDADGDGYDWSISDPVNHYVFPGHNSNRCVSSASYINYVGALSPNNYLVSPQFFLGGSITFYARAKDATYSSEHFGVAVSTTGNQVSDFTMVQEWTMTAKHSAIDDGVPRGSRADGSWYQYTVDLSNFSGPGYVAIRHFNCYDMYWLNVDDITIVSEGSANVSQFSGGETCTLTATPNQGWEFYGWCENGELITTNTQYSFVVASDHYLTARFKKPNTIDFVDPQVEAICVRNWDTDGDGFLSYDEAAAVTDLGNAFSNNGSISSFDEMQYFTGLTSLVDYAFANCENMSSITLPPYLEIIGEGAFWYCRSLGEIVLPESITSIGYNAFYYCQNLVEITIPESVTSIGSYAFRYCSSLTVVNYNAAYIAGDGQYWRWFCDCPSLSTIRINLQKIFLILKRILNTKMILAS